MITDSQELQASVVARQRDSQLLQAWVYVHRASASVELQATVSPRMSDSIQLRASIFSQALAAAAAEAVLAPEITVTFAKED